MASFRETESPDGTFQSSPRGQATAITYRPALAALFSPGRARRFFTHIPESREAIAAEMARLAYVSYAGRGQGLQRHLDRVGFRLVGQPYDDGNTQAFCAEGHVLRVLAFRGSDDLRAWRTNLRSRPARWLGPGRVHEGIARAFEKAWPGLESMTAKPDRRPLLVCGHSLGGALAYLAGVFLPGSQVYGFGIPRVGDAGFAEALADTGRMRFRRYINYRDPVCRIPPRFLGYSDCGVAYYIDRDGRVSAPPPERPRTRWADLEHFWRNLERIIQRPGSRRNDFTDHSPINYAISLWNLLER